MLTRGRKNRKSLTENSHKPKRLKRSQSLPSSTNASVTPEKTNSSSRAMGDGQFVKPVTEYRYDRTSDDYTKKLSLEMLCNVMENLPLRDIMKLECLSRKLQEAVTLHLRLLTKIDFTEGEIYGWMPEGINDEVLARLLHRCPELEAVCGFHPINIAKRRQRVDTLSVPGVIGAFKACKKLKQVETSDIFLLDALLAQMPRIEIAKKFCNRNGGFPIPRSNQLTLTSYARVTYLSLNGVIIPDLPQLLHLQHLELQWVKITDPHPFREFGPVRLETFIMRNCAGPIYALKYVPLIAGLASVHSLKTLELVRVPYLGGLIQHVVEDNWRMQSFRHLEKVTLGSCRHALELDIGYLTLACALKLRELAIQPSLTKDSLFSSLSMAEAQFPDFETLHLSHVDAFPPPGKWSNEELVSNGLADIVESPAMITDIGMRLAGQVFTKVQALHIYNCPHLCLPMLWLSDNPNWQFLHYLHLRRCHAIRLTEFCKLLPQLPKLETLVLEQMFREPPKGCSRVGLSAGTGLGVSSALVQNTSNEGGNQDIANNNPPAAAANQNAAQDDNEDDEDEMFVNDQNLADAGVNNLENDAVDADDLDPDDLEIVEGEVVVLRNCVHYELNVSGPNAVGVSNQNDNGGPSSSIEGVHQNTRSGTRSNLRTENENRNEKGDSDDSDSDFEETVHAVKVETDSPASPTGPNSGNWKPEDCDSDNDNDESIAKNRRSSNKRRSKGKGKSLRGKKGVVKRSKNNSQMHQSCQVTSEDIRETTKKAKETGDSNQKPKKREESQRKKGRSCKKSRGDGSSKETSADDPLEDDAMPSTSGLSSKSDKQGLSSTAKPSSSESNQKGADAKPTMVDKSTSTSDPVIEEDHRQNLIIRSTELKNVCLREVGITNLILCDCPKLSSLSGSACRVLRNVQLKNTPYVKNVSFSQCYKLHYGDLIDEVGLLPRTCNRVINIRPMGNYNRVEMIRFLYRSVLFNGHLCIIHDYCRDPEKSLKSRLRAESWLDLFSEINCKLLDSRGFQQAINNYEQLLKNYQYFFAGPEENDILAQNPSNRNVYTMKVSCGEGHLDVVTDFPWLRSLATMKGNESSNPDFLNQTNTKTSGLYCPEKKGHKDAETCINLLEQEIAEARESKMQLYRHVFLVYVNMCDMSGDPMPDRYV